MPSATAEKKEPGAAAQAGTAHLEGKSTEKTPGALLSSELSMNHKQYLQLGWPPASWGVSTVAQPTR